MIAVKRKHYSPIGLHLGLRTATLVQLVDAGQGLEVLSLAQADLNVDDDVPPDDRDAQTAAMLKRLISDHKFHGRRVVSCLGSQQLFVQNVRLPKLPPDEIEKAVIWEAAERLPYPAAEAEVRHLMAGEVRQDSNIKQEVILLACQHEAIGRHIRLLEKTGLTPVAIDVEPCALLRSLQRTASGLPERRRRAYLHIGEQSTAVIIADAEQILFLKYIAQGSHQLDQAVARQLDLPLKEAHRLCSSVARLPALDADDELQSSIIGAIRQPLETMSAEVELCLRYHKVTFRGQPLQDLVLAGSESSAWLAEYLSERLALSCSTANPFINVSNVPAMAAQDLPGRWATALGLALKQAV